MKRICKVCIIGKYRFPADTRLSQQVQILKKHEIPVDILCLKGESEPKKQKYDSLTIYRYMHKAQVLGFFSYLLHSIIFGIRSLFKLIILSLRNNYSILVFHTLPEFLVFAGIFHRLLGKTIILDARDLTVDLLFSRWSQKKIHIIKSFAIFIEKLCCLLSNEIITASPGFRDCLIQRGIPAEKIIVMINCADPVLFIYQKDRNFRKILNNARIIYHGTVSERFGLIYAIQAMAIVKEKIPGCEFHIYGIYDDLYKKSIEAKISELGLENTIIFHDALLLKDIVEIIKNSDIGIVPYVNDLFMNIALSTKTFEYVANGLPVISSSLRSIEYFFDDSCICYSEPENPRDIANKIIKLCYNPELRKKLSRNANEAYSKINGEVMGKRYWSLIEKHFVKN